MKLVKGPIQLQVASYLMKLIRTAVFVASCFGNPPSIVIQDAHVITETIYQAVVSICLGV